MKQDVFTILEIKGPYITVSAQSEPGTRYLAKCSEQVCVREKWRGSLILDSTDAYVLVAESKLTSTCDLCGVELTENNYQVFDLDEDGTLCDSCFKLVDLRNILDDLRSVGDHRDD